MIKFTCDRCERVLEVPDDRAGSKYECPHCSDMNIVPAAAAVRPAAASAAPGAAAPSPAADRAARAGLPPESGPERQVLKLRPAMFRARPGLFSILLLAAVGGAIAAIVFGFRSRETYAYLCGGASLLAIIGFVVWKIRTMALRLEITNKRTIEARGLLSRRTSEVLHDHVRNVQISQTFFQRIWGTGSIGISSAGQDGLEIHANDIPRPMEVKRVIDSYREKVTR